MKSAASLSKVLELVRNGAWAELVVVAEDVLAGSLASNASKHDAIQEGVAAETVVAVNTTRDLASSIQPLDLAACRANALRLGSHLEAAHAVVDDRSDDGDIERLRSHGVARDDVVVE